MRLLNWKTLFIGKSDNRVNNEVIGLNLRQLWIMAILFALLLMPVVSNAQQTIAENSGERIASPAATTNGAPASASNNSSTNATPNANSTGEVVVLKQRVQELEEQNRQIMDMLKEMRTKLDKVAAPATANAPEAAAAPVASAPAASAASAPNTAAAKTETKPQNDKGDFLRWSDIIGEGNKLKFYGFLRLDINSDSQRPNSGQSPFFIISSDPRVTKNSAGLFSMTPRLTRFGIDYTGPQISELGNAQLSGKFETDFDNGGTESRQIIRIRLAYLKLSWNNSFSVLAGQDWDIFSPLNPTVDNDTVLWNAGNIGDRRPQVRAAFEPKLGKGKISFATSIGLTGAIDSQDLDSNGFRDGEESGRPNVEARVGIEQPTWVKDQNFKIGLSGIYSWINTSKPFMGLTEFRGQGVNIDYTMPIAKVLAFRGEGWWGRNMGDFRGGAGQSINATNGRVIRDRGGWAELNLRLSHYLTINPGISCDDPVDRDVADGGRTRNATFYVANRISITRNLLVGADYLRWKTTYKGLLSGIDNRVNVFFQYSF